METELKRFLSTMVCGGHLLTSETAERLVWEHYGISVRAERLTGERDENFKLATSVGPGYVFKVAHAAEDPSVSELPTAALLHIEEADPGLPCPRVCRARGGRSSINFKDELGRQRTASLVTFLPGQRLASASRSREQRAECGRIAARLGRALRDFVHPASHRTLLWDLKNVGHLRLLLSELPDFPETRFVQSFIAEFEVEVRPQLASVRHQVVHNDLNVTNLLVDTMDEARVIGVIDFGDAVHTALVADVAIALVGQIANASALPECIEEFLSGYQSVEPLDSRELQLLPRLAAGRVLQGVLIPSWHRAQNPQSGHFQPMESAHIQGRIELARDLTTRKLNGEPS